MSGVDKFHVDQQHDPVLWGNEDHNVGQNYDSLAIAESSEKQNLVEDIDSIEVDLNNMEMAFSYEDFVEDEENFNEDPVLKYTSNSLKSQIKNKTIPSDRQSQEDLRNDGKCMSKTSEVSRVENNGDEELSKGGVQMKKISAGDTKKEEGQLGVCSKEDYANMPIQVRSAVMVPEKCYESINEEQEDVNEEHEDVNEEHEDVNEEFEEALGDIYDAWDPIKSHYLTAINHSSVNTNAPGSALLLENAPPENIQLKDIPCQFHNGEGKCWKDRCLYYHPKYGSKDYDMALNEKVRRTPISYWNQLNAKEIAPRDSIMEVTMEHIKDPWKFFVSTDGDWKCCCDTPKEDIPEEMVRRHRLESMLTKEMMEGWKFLTLRFSDYMEYQLVAVRRTVKGKTVFSRAVVLETTVDVQDFETRNVEVQLLDTGAKMRVTFNELCHLPAKYVAIFPPLAYQCMLHGISPISAKWTPEAVNYFKELLSGKKCILQVIKSAQWLQPDSPDRLFESKPYEVELRVRMPDPVTGKERYQSVAEVMARDFHGVLWSLCPFRPALSRIIPRATLSLFGNTIHSPELLKQVLEREKLRKERLEEKADKIKKVFN